MKSRKPTRPLLDMLKVLFWFYALTVGAFYGIIVVALIASGDVFRSLAAFCFFLSVIALPLCQLLILWPGPRPQIMWLRAFRNDRKSARIRHRIQAIMGPNLRLTGIRPPQYRRGLIFQVFAPNLVALGYGGSSYCDMEAGDDWLARLEASLETCRLVIIDLRAWTSAVADEIALCSIVMGPQRTLFLTDASRSAEEWRELVTTHASSPKMDTAAFLSVEGLGTKEWDSCLRDITARLPKAPAGESEDGRKLAIVRRPYHLRWWARSLDSVPGRIIAYFAGTIALVVGTSVMARLVSNLPEPWGVWIERALGILFYGGFCFLLLLAVFRLVRRCFQFWWIGRYAFWISMGRLVMVLAVFLAFLISAGLGNGYGPTAQVAIRHFLGIEARGTPSAGQD